MKSILFRISLCLSIFFFANTFTCKAGGVIYEAECSNTLNATINMLRGQIENLQKQGLHTDDTKKILASFEEANRSGYKPEMIWQIEKTVKIYDGSGFEGYNYSFLPPQSKYSDYNAACAQEVINKFCPGGYRTMGAQLDCNKNSK